MKLLDFLAKDGKAVFKFFAKPAVQKTVVAAEGVAEVFAPQLTDVFGILNHWGMVVLKTQMMANSVGDVPDDQRAGMAISEIEPLVLSFIAEHGLAVPTPMEMQLINDALVVILNAFKTKA